MIKGVKIMNQLTNNVHAAGQPQKIHDDEINLVELFQVVFNRKKLLVAIVLIVTALAVIYSLVAKEIYRAEAVIMPVGGSSGLASLASQLGGMPIIGGMMGGAASGTERFMALLNTRTLAEEIVKKYDFKKVLFKDLWDEKNNRWLVKDSVEEPSMEQAYKALKSHVELEEDLETGTIKIYSSFEDPKLAAKVANAYVEGLQAFINDNELTVAKRNRIFIEDQLEQNKRQLLKIGRTINEFYEEGKVSDVDSRVNVDLSVQDKLDLKSEDLALYEFEGRDKVIAEVKAKQKAILAKTKKINVIKDIPQQVYLQYLMMRRELLGEVNALLSQQYEMAKIEESKKDLAFQVIDPARVPESIYKPKRRLMVMVGFVASIFLGIFLIFFLEYIKKAILEHKK